MPWVIIPGHDTKLLQLLRAPDQLLRLHCPQRSQGAQPDLHLSPHPGGRDRKQIWGETQMCLLHKSLGEIENFQSAKLSDVVVSLTYNLRRLPFTFLSWRRCRMRTPFMDLNTRWIYLGLLGCFWAFDFHCLAKHFMHWFCHFIYFIPFLSLTRYIGNCVAEFPDRPAPSLPDPVQAPDAGGGAQLPQAGGGPHKAGWRLLNAARVFLLNIYLNIMCVMGLYLYIHMCV